MATESLLIIDPEPTQLAPVLDHLTSVGLSAEVLTLRDLIEPSGRKKRPKGVALIGLSAFNGHRAEILRAVRQSDPHIVVICGVEDDSAAKEALLRAGADALVDRPYSPSQVESAVRMALELRRLREEVARLRPLVEGRQRFEGLIGASEPMTSLYRLLEQVGLSDAPVLIQGEEGTEVRETIEAIQAFSDRRGAPLAQFDGAKAGLDQLAHPARGEARTVSRSGIVWVENLEEMALDVQAKLAQKLAKDCGTLAGWRLMASTREDLFALAQEGRFSRDLYYKVSVFAVRIPPLRDRIEDIPLLASERLRDMCAVGEEPMRLSFNALLALSAHDWPGNVAELAQSLESASLNADGAMIEPDALPPEIAAKASRDDSCSDGVSLRRAKNEFELRYLRTLLSRTHGNISQAARISKVGRPYLYKKIRQHELVPSDFR
jgi:DNA-binding NtrC family response regulator